MQNEEKNKITRALRALRALRASNVYSKGGGINFAKKKKGVHHISFGLRYMKK